MTEGHVTGAFHSQRFYAAVMLDIKVWSSELTLTAVLTQETTLTECSIDG